MQGALPHHQDQDVPPAFPADPRAVDIAFQPPIDERRVKELANPLAFVAEATNILLLGLIGEGKSHLAVSCQLSASCEVALKPRNDL